MHSVLRYMGLSGPWLGPALWPGFIACRARLGMATALERHSTGEGEGERRSAEVYRGNSCLQMQQRPRALQVLEQPVAYARERARRRPVRHARIFAITLLQHVRDDETDRVLADAEE